MNRRRLLTGGQPNSHGLPDGYREVEYLEATGNSYIISNYAPVRQYPYMIELGIRYAGDGQNCRYLATRHTSGNVGTLAFIVQGSTGKYGFAQWDSGSTAYSADTAGTGYHDIRIEAYGTFPTSNGYTRKHVYADGIREIESNSPTNRGADGTNIGIMCRTTGKTAGSYTVGEIAPAGNRIYYVRFCHESADNPVHEYIPCYRVSDGRTGMYDTVAGEFLPNGGTAEFICGGEI